MKHGDNTNPKTILCATSIHCQYSSGTKDVCIIRALMLRNATKPRNNVHCDDSSSRSKGDWMKT